MTQRFGISILLLLLGQPGVAQDVSDERSFFQGICVAFQNHPLQDGRIVDCMTTNNEVTQSVWLRGENVTGRDLDELCMAIGGKPEQGGNLGVSVNNSNGRVIEQRCQIALPYRRPMRRIPVSICDRLMAARLDIGTISSCSASDHGPVSVQGVALERASLVQLCRAIGEPTTLGNVEIVSRDKTGMHISAGCQVDSVPPHLMHPKH